MNGLRGALSNSRGYSPSPSLWQTLGRRNKPLLFVRLQAFGARWASLRASGSNKFSPYMFLKLMFTSIRPPCFFCLCLTNFSCAECKILIEKGVSLFHPHFQKGCFTVSLFHPYFGNSCFTVSLFHGETVSLVSPVSPDYFFYQIRIFFSTIFTS